jgi:SPOR domain
VGAQVGAPVAGTSGSKKIRTVAIHAGQPDSADAAAPAPAARPIAPRPVAAAPQGGQAGQGGNGPLSIVPSQGGQGSQGSADAARTRTALAHPAAPAAAAEPAPAAAGGGYSVQVSSQRSEAEAQAAYRGLQAKYPTQLGSRTATVRQVDLGDKGIYFRTLVGPYGSSEEAAQMCSSLKAAGGSCLVQRN